MQAQPAVGAVLRHAEGLDEDEDQRRAAEHHEVRQEAADARRAEAEGGEHDPHGRQAEGRLGAQLREEHVERARRRRVGDLDQEADPHQREHDQEQTRRRAERDVRARDGRDRGSSVGGRPVRHHGSAAAPAVPAQGPRMTGDDLSVIMALCINHRHLTGSWDVQRSHG